MRPVAIVMAVAVLAAGGTALLARTWLERHSTPPATTAAPSTEVLVVARDVAAGASLQSDDLSYQSWPVSLALPRLVTRTDGVDAKAQFVGQIARRALIAGEPVTSEAIAQHDGAGILAGMLTPGMRAVSVVITNPSAVSGFITPGDRVDIVLAADLSHTLEGEQNNHSPSATLVRYASETVLTDIRVLAIDQQITRGTDGGAIQGKTATVEVTPKQAEVLTTVGMLGTVQLVLRGKTQTEQTAADPSAPKSPGFSGDVEVSKALQALLGNKAVPPTSSPSHKEQLLVQINRAGQVTTEGLSK